MREESAQAQYKAYRHVGYCTWPLVGLGANLQLNPIEDRPRKPKFRTLAMLS